jgi:hypothetical protein
MLRLTTGVTVDGRQTEVIELVTDELLADGRIDAVAADDQVRIDRRAVGEPDGHAPPRRFEPGAPLPVGDGDPVDGVEQELLETMGLDPLRDPGLVAAGG